MALVAYLAEIVYICIERKAKKEMQRDEYSKIYKTAIKTAINARGLEYADIAQKLGRSLQSVRNDLSNKVLNNWQIKKLFEYAAALGVPAWLLLTDPDTVREFVERQKADGSTE